MNIRALVVDASSAMRKMVERSVRQSGIELTELFQAANGAEALAVLQDNVVDLISL
jgi:two-component system chemotaxis response regulator CheY